MSRSPITCHVLDSTSGKPAAEVAVELLHSQPDATFLSLQSGITDKDGRCSTLLSPETKLQPGVYKMIFSTGPYFASQGKETFYPVVEIIFNYSNPSEHYHIPLLLSPYSYTTYRGS